MAETERVKPRSIYIEESIALALESKWAEALTSNENLVATHGADEDTYNRIGKALTELGRLDEAIDSYGHALKLNPLNLIAQKNARKLGVMLETKERLGSAAAATLDVDLFTEEPGKSALTLLPAPKKAAAVGVAPGDVVNLEIDGTHLNARTVKGVLLGQLDTKLARRLLPLMKTGNRYSAGVARVRDDGIEIMVREEFQSSENVRRSSFPASPNAAKDYRPYAKESLLASREIDAEPLAEDEEEIDIVGADDDTDILEGMRTVEGEDDDDATALTTEDEDDDDDKADDNDEVRPEDQY